MRPLNHDRLVAEALRLLAQRIDVEEPANIVDVSAAVGLLQSQAELTAWRAARIERGTDAAIARPNERPIDARRAFAMGRIYAVLAHLIPIEIKRCQTEEDDQSSDAALSPSGAGAN